MTAKTSSGLPADDKEKSEYLMDDYMFGYFPDAWLAELEVAIEGNKQHNPGQKLHWAREKSTDHMNKAWRHIWLYRRGERKDTDNTYHLAKAIWRLKARLQLDIEEERKSIRHVEIEGLAAKNRRLRDMMNDISDRHGGTCFPKNSMDPEAGS